MQPMRRIAAIERMGTLTMKGRISSTFERGWQTTCFEIKETTQMFWKVGVLDGSKSHNHRYGLRILGIGGPTVFAKSFTTTSFYSNRCCGSKTRFQAPASQDAADW